MTKHNAKEYLPLVQALAEGKTIQFKESTGKWIDLESSHFNYPPDHYRIKPEPMELWVNVYPCGTLQAHSARHLAASYLYSSGRTIRMREVVE